MSAPVVDEQLDCPLIAHEHRRGEWRDAASPGQVDLGAAVDELLYHLQASILGGAVERGGAFQVARVDFGAALQEKSDELGLPGGCCAAQGACAQPVARLERRAIVQQLLRQFQAAFVGGGVEHGIHFGGGRASLDLLVAVLGFLAGPNVGAGFAAGGNRKYRQSRDDEIDAEDATQTGYAHENPALP